MAKYILTGKSTIGHKDDKGEFHTFRKGDEVPEAIYNQLPARVQGFIGVSGAEEKDTFNFKAEEIPEEKATSDNAPVNKKSKKKKADAAHE